MLNWKRKRVWIPALLLLALVIGAAFNLVSGGGIEREKQRLRAAGLPTTPDEWDRWYPSVPPERNAALLVLDAANYHVTPAGKNDPNQTDLPPPGTPLTSEHLETIGEYLADNRETLNLLALERVVSEHPLSLEEISSLVAILETVEKEGQRGMHRALIGERGYGLRFLTGSFDEFASVAGGVAPLSGGRQLFGIAMFTLYKASGVQQQDARIYFETMNGFIVATTNDFPEMMRLSRQTETNYYGTTTQGFGKMAVFSRMLLPALLKAVSKEAVIAGSLRSARAVLIIEAARAQLGAMPEDISSLQFPPDPFTGEPLIFEKLEKGYMVYSPGASASAGTQRRPRIGFTVAR